MQEPRPISQIARLLQLDYKSLYDFLHSKKGQHLFAQKKLDGLIWVRPIPKGFYLTEGTQNSNKPNFDPKNAYRYHYGKTGPERKAAISRTLKTIDVRNIEDDLEALFDEYLQRINEAVIVLAPDPDKYFFGDCLELPYLTRFTDEGRKVEQLKKYERIFDETAQRYKNAVMLTLTTDPKQQDHLWDANKKISKNLNRLMSFLARRNHGKRLKYLNVFEFQKNGRLHLHIVFFNVRFLISWHEMKSLWKKYGQGEVIDFKPLTSDGKEWNWTHDRPKDAKDESPTTYLKKYLKKNLYDETANMQYWVYNTRFFTNSRCFEQNKSKLPGRGWYVFIGVFYEGFGNKTAPAWIRNKNFGVWGNPPKQPREVSDDTKTLMQLCRTSW